MGTLESPKPLSSVVLGLQALGHKAPRTASLTHNSQSLTAAWGSRLLGSSKSVVYGDRRTTGLSSHPSTPQGLAWSESISCPHPDISNLLWDHTQILQFARVKAKQNKTKNSPSLVAE